MVAADAQLEDARALARSTTGKEKLTGRMDGVPASRSGEKANEK